MLDTSRQIAQNVKFEIGKEAADKLPFITTTNNEAGSYQSNFADLLTRTMGFIMAIAALIVLIYLIWGALEWITSGGDKGKLENARNKITQSVIGIIVLSATTALFVLIQQFIGIQVINFGQSSVTSPKVEYACMPMGICRTEGKMGDRSHCENCHSPNVCCEIEL